MPPKSKTPTIELPQPIADEIADAARQTGRSTAFIVARALAAGQNAPTVELDPPLTLLALTSSDDDPPSALAAAKKTTPAALAAAWTATRSRFAAWIAREQEAQKAEHADDLDRALHDAAEARTLPARLAELAQSEYVRVRALVARHPAAPPAALERLRADPDRVVKAALAARG